MLENYITCFMTGFEVMLNDVTQMLKKHYFESNIRGDSKFQCCRSRKRQISNASFAARMTLRAVYRYQFRDVKIICKNL